MKPHHRQLKNQDPDEAEHQLYKAIAAIKNANEAQMFFSDLCTPAEIQAMADRWRVVGLLQDNVPYREINQKTGVSVTTVTRVARCLLLGENGYHTIYKRIGRKQTPKK